MRISFEYDHIVAWLPAGAAAFVLASLLIVLIFDRGRWADHIARSLVQIGVACASVALAFFLLERQFSIQDERAFRQQAALAVIRATISALAVDIQRAPALYKDVIRTSCTSFEKCNLDPVASEKYGYETFLFLEWIIRGIEPRIIVASPTYREPLAQMVRTSSIFSPDAAYFMMVALHNLESEIPNQKTSLARVKASVVPLTKISGHMPPKDVATQFFWLARIQASSFLDAAQFLCDLFQVEAKLDSDDFIKRRLPLDGVKISRQTPNELCDDDRVRWAVPIVEWIEKEAINLP